MVQVSLNPCNFDCDFSGKCTRRELTKCLRCQNNKKAVEKRIKEKDKKNYFKKLR